MVESLVINLPNDHSHPSHISSNLPIKSLVTRQLLTICVIKINVLNIINFRDQEFFLTCVLFAFQHVYHRQSNKVNFLRDFRPPVLIHIVHAPLKLRLPNDC